MSVNVPTTEPFVAGEKDVRPWEETREGIAEGRTFWLATVKPDGRPHAMPVLGVVVDDRLHFVANAASRKARNLAHNASVVVTTTTDDVDLVVEGTAHKVRDDARLGRVADAFASKYEWLVTVRDGAFQDTEGAPTAGPAPYDVYELTPALVFAFGTSEPPRPTRYRFQREVPIATSR